MFRVQVLLLLLIVCISTTTQVDVNIPNRFFGPIVNTNGEVLLICHGPSVVEWLHDGKLIDTTLDGYDATRVGDSRSTFASLTHYLRIDSSRKGNGGKFACRNPANHTDISETEVKVITKPALRVSFPFKRTDDRLDCRDGIDLVCSSGKNDINMTWFINGGEVNGAYVQVADITKVRKGQEFESHMRLKYAEAAKKSDYQPVVDALKDRTYTFFCRENTYEANLKMSESNHLSMFRDKYKGGASMTFIQHSVVSVVTVLGLLVSHCGRF